MDKDKLVSLAERCEAAMGPDSNLDHAIWAAVRGERVRSAPFFTKSLDAAMTLVPEGGNFNLFQRTGKAYAGVNGEGGEAATPALALCAAALRSHALRND